MKKILMGCLVLMAFLPAGFAVAEGKNMTKSKMMEHCKEMMEQKQKMEADMKAQDDQLAELTSKMNNAPQDKKMVLMAGIITQIVENKAAMDVRKSKIQDEMMKHMMEHMRMGKDSMSHCPMMKGMESKEEKK